MVRCSAVYQPALQSDLITHGWACPVGLILALLTCRGWLFALPPRVPTPVPWHQACDADCQHCLLYPRELLLLCRPGTIRAWHATCSAASGADAKAACTDGSGPCQLLHCFLPLPTHPTAGKLCNCRLPAQGRMLYRAPCWLCTASATSGSPMCCASCSTQTLPAHSRAVHRLPALETTWLPCRSSATSAAGAG